MFESFMQKKIRGAMSFWCYLVYSVFVRRVMFSPVDFIGGWITKEWVLPCNMRHAPY